MSDHSNVYNVEGNFVIATDYNFLEKAITHQTREDSVIPMHQFLKVEKIFIDEDTKQVTFHCGLYGYLLN